MSNTTGIYKIVSPSGKVYIGQSFQIEKRWASYRNGYARKQPALYASFNKYGVGCHHFEILCVLPNATHQVVMDRHEQLFMDLYREMGYRLLNLRHAGSVGRHSNVSRARMRGKLGKWMTGRKLAPETIAKRSAKQKGMKRSDETRTRLALSKQGKKNPCHGKRPWNYGLKGFRAGRIVSDETRQRLVEAWARRREREKVNG